MDRIGKIWVNIVRRDIPKHHRNFTTFHRKQLIDAKRCSEYCQREACTIPPTYFSSVISHWFLVFSYIVQSLCCWFCIFGSLYFNFYESIFLQVRMKVSRSLKWIRGASTRTRKLARDMLLFWKRIDKEMVHFNSFVKHILVLKSNVSIGLLKWHPKFLMFSGK